MKVTFILNHIIGCSWLLLRVLTLAAPHLLQPLVLGIVNVFWQSKAMLFTTGVLDEDAKSVLVLRLGVIALHE